MKLITGHTGTAHVYAIDDATLNKMSIGAGDYVLPFGGKFALTKTDARRVSISDGFLLTQGRLGVIRYGNDEVVGFPSTSSGYYKVFIIAAEYSMDADGIETMKLVVVPGSASKTAPSGSSLDPDLADGDIDNGETYQMALYRVVVKELNIHSTARLFNIVDGISKAEVKSMFNTVNDRISNLESDIDAKLDEEVRRVRAEINEILSDLDKFYYEKGESFTMGYGVPCAGLITNDAKRLMFTLPTRPVQSGSVSVDNLILSVRLSTGGYARIQSGVTFYKMYDLNVTPDSDSNIGEVSGIGSNLSSIKAGIKSITAVRTVSGIRVTIDFRTTLKRPDQKTRVVNNTPVSVYVGANSIFSFK